MKELRNQIADRCIYFNGVMNKTCEAGINYEDVRVNDRPYKFPCLKEGGTCPKSKFPTEEEVEQELNEIEEMAAKNLGTYALIKEHFMETGERVGKITCACKGEGEVSFSIAELNDHVWAKCAKCDLSFME